jgi:hypothetical protein
MVSAEENDSLANSTQQPVAKEAKPPIDINRLTCELVTTILETMQKAAKDESLHIVDREVAMRRLQERLMKTHASLFAVQVVSRTMTGKRTRDDKPKKMRPWRPSRPTLAREAAEMIKDGVGMVEVPAEKREGCAFPFKIFARHVASKIGAGGRFAEVNKSAVEYAIGEVVNAVFNEAETLRSTRGMTGATQMHGSLDASWKGTVARGCGIAMDEAGKALIATAAARVVDRLDEPAMQVAKACSA